MDNIKEITAGIPVNKFLSDINDNFTNLQSDVNNLNNLKQSKIYTASVNDTIETTSKDEEGKTITIQINSDGTPSGGSNGDIVIVYE